MRNCLSRPGHMSTAGPLDPPTNASDPWVQPRAESGAPGWSTPPQRPVDRILVQQTKNEIRGLVEEITALSRADMPVEQFYGEFLRRVVAALAGHGGAIWTAGTDGALEIQYQINLPAEEVLEDVRGQQRHALLLRSVVSSGQATLVPPQSGSPADEEAGNPTGFLLILAALRVEQQAVGVVEVFQRPGGGPTTQRGYLRFLVQMCELASDFLTSRRLRNLGDRQRLWERLERFIREVHRSLESQATAYTVVNEGRRLIGCDRVSLALAQGKHQQVVAVSGLDALDRRSEEVKLLGRLATVVAAAGRPLWHAGRTRDLPPQIEKHLDAYLDRAHSKLIAVLPLDPPADGDSPAPRRLAAPGPLGTLVIERMGESRIAEGMVERAEAVAVHAASALRNAREHESLFLLPLWRVLGRARWCVQVRNFPKIFVGLVMAAAAVLTLALVPADFELAARGKLQPALRRDVFAPLDGVVEEVPVRHAQAVSPGQVLARLSNKDLEVEFSALLGRRDALHARLLSLQRAQLDERRASIEERNRTAAEYEEVRELCQSLDAELRLLDEKRERLTVRSQLPVTGQVVTWNVADTLLHRPVQKGQLLMTIVDPSGDWELELFMPERRIGHVARAAAKCPRGLPVTFMLASHPDRFFAGRVVEIQRSAETHEELGHAVRIRVAIRKDDLPELRSETSVTARVHCGRRAAGFVLFHDLIETLQSKVLFWL